MTKKLRPQDLKTFVCGRHQPYTDYNEDIVMWLKKNSEGYTDYAAKRKYIFSAETKFYCHNYIFDCDHYYTNDEFKKLIGMPLNNESVSKFTPADLKDGMICTARGGYVYTVKGDRMFRDGGHLFLDSINHDWSVGMGDPKFDIVLVEQPTVLYKYVDPKQESIKKELELAEAKKVRLESHINILKSKLQ